MSVLKSRRKDAAAQFIADARELRIKTIRMAKKFPSSYRYIFVNNILDLAAEIYTGCLKGNAVYMHKDMTEGDYMQRRAWLNKAYAACDALLAEITFCYSALMEGENIFKKREDRDRRFTQWTEAGIVVKNRLKALLKSDKERYMGYQKEKE